MECGIAPSRHDPFLPMLPCLYALDMAATPTATTVLPNKENQKYGGYRKTERHKMHGLISRGLPAVVQESGKCQVFVQCVDFPYFDCSPIN